MSNRRTRLNDLTRIMRTQRALGLAPEILGYASVEVIPADDESADALATVALSPRAAAIRRTQEMADFMGERFAVWENAQGVFRSLRADEWPDGSEWGRIATVEPR